MSTGPTDPGERDVRALERLTASERERARRIQQLAIDQLGAVRREMKRRKQRQQARSARKRNR